MPSISTDVLTQKSATAIVVAKNSAENVTNANISRSML